VGSNASILPEIIVGAWATVGAGSSVIQDVPERASAVGVPAEVFSRAAEAGPVGVPAGVADEQLEALIAGVWCEVLGVKQVECEQNFFDVGGNSLRAIQGRERIRQLTGVDFALTDLFRFPTVRSLARHLAGLSAPARDDAVERGRLRRASLLRTVRTRN
jgi:acyl carrier protein